MTDLDDCYTAFVQSKTMTCILQGSAGQCVLCYMLGDAPVRLQRGIAARNYQ